MYRLIEDADRDSKILYCNTCFVVIQFFILFIVALQVGPLVNDATVLIHDAGESLKDLAELIPAVNNLMPKAENTTFVLAKMIPEINQGLRILKQICSDDPRCSI